jgi:hypothetical protein
LAGDSMENLLRSSSDTEFDAEERTRNVDFPDRLAPMKVHGYERWT